MDALLLSRIQFGANISFHILFPTITIALGWVLLLFKFAYARTKDEKWMEAYFFWVKIFALSFALGVVSGITMSFQFGTNWPGYMEAVGNIAGPLLDHVLRLALGADEDDVFAVGDGAGDVPLGEQETFDGLLDVDDVDPVALAVDVGTHLGVPAAGALAEVDAGLDQILNQSVCHQNIPRAATPAWGGQARAQGRFGESGRSRL